MPEEKTRTFKSTIHNKFNDETTSRIKNCILLFTWQALQFYLFLV